MADSIEGVMAHHKVNYVELHSTDNAAMKAFFGDVFGWTFQDWGETYVEITGAGISGGFDTEGEARPRGGAIIMIYSDDLDASEAAVRQAGGTITTEAFDFPGGRRFHFTDPSANEWAVWMASGPASG